MNKPNKPGKNSNPWRAAALVSAIGADMLICILGGYYVGKWMSGRMGGEPIWMAVGTLTGLGFGIVSIVYLIKKFLLEDQDG